MEAIPFFFNLVKSKVLDEDLFTIWLSSDPEEEPAGILTFGYADPLRYEGNITYHPVIMKAYWYAAGTLFGMGAGLVWFILCIFCATFILLWRLQTSAYVLGCQNASSPPSWCRVLV
jgi:hypothetical protein